MQTQQLDLSSVKAFNHDLKHRLRTLSRAAVEATHADTSAILGQSLHELGAALEELRATEEELREQNDRMLGVRLELERESARVLADFREAPVRSEERRVGKECRSRW